VQNRTGAEIRLVWIDFEGNRDTRKPFERMPVANPGESLSQSTWARHVFVIADATGRALCTLTVEEDHAVAEVTGPCP
jgi:hypothetical protein